MLGPVTLREIERVFAIIEARGLSREAIFIPLRPSHPGVVRMRSDNRLEIVFDREQSLEANLAMIEHAVDEILATPAGRLLQRADD
jgi:hypothetical protein